MSVVWCEVYIFWTSFYGPYATLLSIYFDSHNSNQIGPLEAHIGILILQCYISFHPILTQYVMYPDLRSDETIHLQSRTCAKIRLNHWNDVLGANARSRSDFVSWFSNNWLYSSVPAEFTSSMSLSVFPDHFWQLFTMSQSQISQFSDNYPSSICEDASLGIFLFFHLMGHSHLFPTLHMTSTWPLLHLSLTSPGLRYHPPSPNTLERVGPEKEKNYLLWAEMVNNGFVMVVEDWVWKSDETEYLKITRKTERYLRLYSFFTRKKEKKKKKEKASVPQRSSW